MPAAPTPPEPRVRLGPRYAVALALTGLCWAGLVGAVVYLVYARTAWVHEADAAHVREWLDESRVHRETLPDLIGRYVRQRDKQAAIDPATAPGHPDVVRTADEIREQMRVMTPPPRVYQGYLPLFPDVYLLEARFADRGWDPITWESPVPRPRQQNETRVEK